MRDCLGVEGAAVGALVSNVGGDVDDEFALDDDVIGARLF